MKPLHILIPANLKYLEYVRKMFFSYCEANAIPSETSNDMMLALDEALCNVIEHNYKNSSKDNVKISLNLGPKKMTVIIEDKGSEYSFIAPTCDEVQRKVIDRSKRGFGQYLIKSIMTNVRLISSKTKGNKLILEKSL